MEVPEMVRYPGGFWPVSRSMTLPGAAAAVMSTPGAVTSGLTAPSPVRGAGAGEVGEGVGVVDGADGEGGVGAARGVDGAGSAAAAVAGGDGEEHALVGAEFADGRFERVDLGGVGAAEAEVDDVGALGDGPFHAGEDAGVVAGAVVVEDLAVQEFRAGRDALERAGRAGARTGGDGGDVRAVAEVVPGVRGGGEVLFGDDLAGEVGVGGVDAGVEDGDLDACAVVSGGPRLVGADLPGALVEGGGAHGVEPDGGDAGGGGAAAGALLGVGQRLPDSGGVLGGRADGFGAEGGVRTGHLEAVGGAQGGPGGGGGPALVADDQLEAAGAAVPVLGAAQLGDVEEPGVELSGADQGLGVVGQDAGVAARAAQRDGYVLAALGAFEADRSRRRRRGRRGRR
ncbi:hypothetical protein GCM10020254_28850 [Streptomyces goshikiensis]